MLAVFVDWFLTSDNLVRAMITGRKSLDDEEAARQKPLAGWWRAAIVAVFATGLGAVLFRQTDFGAMATAGERGGYQHEAERHEVGDD